jgi:hypothetical protein
LLDVSRVCVPDPSENPKAPTRPPGTEVDTTNVADAVGLSVEPVLNALARRVTLLVSVRGDAYRVEPLVGSVPSVVYRIDAPVVDVVKVTLTEPENVPPFGLIAGAATAPGGDADATETVI